MDSKAYLLSWGENFLKNRDLFFKKIVKIENKSDFLVIHYKDRIQHVIAGDNLKVLFGTLKEGQHYAIVVFNTKENFNVLKDNWSDFVKYKNVIIYFINPESAGESRWTISPYVHNQIADPESLNHGLTSLFETVEVISPDKIKKVINQD